jgi:hypothetical protein
MQLQHSVVVVQVRGASSASQALHVLRIPTSYPTR